MKRKIFGIAVDMTNYALLFSSVTILACATSNQAYNYKKHRKSSIQEDLNKLYDNRPTASSSGDERSSQSFRNFHENKYGKEDDYSRLASNIGEEKDTEVASTPYFDLDNSGNVTAVLGKTAYLNCRVKNIKNQTVSWLRHKDTHLLTIGRLTYTSDLRFRAIHKMYSEDWMLEIKPTSHRDSGRYECQISTTPPTSHVVYLKIAEPKTAILGGPDIHLKEGSTMNLTCIITDSPEPPSYIFWRHDDKIISYDSPRGGVSVITEKGDITSSFLVVQLARPSDAGIYTCSPAIGKPVSVNVHVLRGEYKLGLGTNSASILQPSLMQFPSKLFSHIFTLQRYFSYIFISSSLSVPLLKSSLSFEHNLIAYIVLSLVSLSVISHLQQRMLHSNAIIQERSRCYTVTPVTVIDSDVKRQEDMLTSRSREEGMSCNQNIMVKKSIDVNAHTNSYSNKKNNRW